MKVHCVFSPHLYRRIQDLGLSFHIPEVTRSDYTNNRSESTRSGTPFTMSGYSNLFPETEEIVPSRTLVPRISRRETGLR